MESRLYLLLLVAIVGVSQWFATAQTVSQRDALMPRRAAAERTVERLHTLEAAGGVEATRPGGRAEAIACDSLSFVGGGPVCHTAAPELRLRRDRGGDVRVTAVRRTPLGTHIVAQARVHETARGELQMETLP